MIDHTLLRSDASAKEIRKLCAEALRFGFKTVCVNPCWVSLSAKLLRGSPVGVCTVIGFPLGATTTNSKAHEASEAVSNGAHECDAVINIGKLKSRDYAYVARELKVLRGVTRGRVLKVIIETALLNRREIVQAAKITKKCGADFVKTSTGFCLPGATAADVRLLRKVVGKKMGVKVSGGLRSLADAKRMLLAGATRIGTSHALSMFHSI